MRFLLFSDTNFHSDRRVAKTKVVPGIHINYTIHDNNSGAECRVAVPRPRAGSISNNDVCSLPNFIITVAYICMLVVARCQTNCCDLVRSQVMAFEHSVED